MKSIQILVLAVMIVGAVSCGPVKTPVDAGASDAGAQCIAGTTGCPCVGGRCGSKSDGVALVCVLDVCEDMGCQSGAPGCACKNGTDCNGTGDTCIQGFCQAANCAPASLNCVCIAGTCDVGLQCLNNSMCVDSKGFEGGACLPGATCHRGARCDGTSNTCVFCEPGTTQCQCNNSRQCNMGLSCVSDQCVSSANVPPANPKCFTPCRGDFTRQGVTVTCSSDGLIDGCLDNQTCTNGSCLGANETKPTCTSDSQCPFFQVCLSGQCFSNCDVNADCQSESACSKHACRKTCTVSGSSNNCPNGTACTSNDGQNGVCMPLGAPSGAPRALPVGGLSMLVQHIALSNVQSSASFSALPQSAITQDVTVKKIWHQVTMADGTTERVEDKVDAAGTPIACSGAACPMWWLKIGAGTTATAQVQQVQYRLPPTCFDDLNDPIDAGARVPCPHVRLENAGGIQAVRWEGMLRVSSGDSHIDVMLSYVERPEGQWTGSMNYFGSFNRVGIDAWIARANKSDVSNVDNGLIQRWGALRTGSIEGWGEFLAVLTATRTESWKFGTVATKCKDATGQSLTSACYPYLNQAGVQVYVQNTTATPIPSGVSELPMALNLKISNASQVQFEGRVESSVAMHYPGNPALKIEFEKNPALSASCFAGGGSDCLVFLKNINAVTADLNRLVSSVGARFIPSGPCPTSGYSSVAVPWLVPGFTNQTALDSMGQRTRTECRDSLVPFDSAASSQNAKTNASLAGANPVADGNVRKRTLRFLDGALVNQSQLFVLFEESYESFIPGQAPTTAYGYFLLKRTPADLNAMSYVGLPTATATRTPVAGGAKCSTEMVRGLLKNPALDVNALSNNQTQQLVNVLLRGRAADSDYVALPVNDNVHYWCESTGFFNGGPRDNGTANGLKVACPAGSKVIFFNTGLNRNNAQMAADACQTTVGSDGRAQCFETLSLWRSNASVIVEYEPVFQCTNPLDAYCDDDRLNLRNSKTFFKRQVSNSAPNLLALQPLIDSAFRYKTRFRSTSGGTLGFAPQQCVPNSDAIPYCYDPVEIQQARDRIDCLVDIYSRPGVVTGTVLDATTRTAMLGFLQSNFSNFPNGGYEGFERLYAELLIMQGDESLTAAYASRFDLASVGGASFNGSQFEPGGIDLTGVAGAEMYRLYQAVQYYQLALDRLYAFGPNFQKALSYGSVGSSNNFLTPSTVTNYLERLVRAASQKSRAWAEVARRYQNFNRPGLARSVIERAYVGTYLESALISRLMLDIAQGSGPSVQDQIRVTIEKAQRNYRMALLEMREVYGQLTDAVNYFGYAPEYIPFPALDVASSTSLNAFDSVDTLAHQRLEVAKQRELTALAAGRQGRVDAVQFQADLTSIRNTYENQLAQMCGTFMGDDGQAYPSIKKYAKQNARATLMGDPCGRMGNGDIHGAMANVKDADLRLKGVIQRHENILEDIEIERQRVAQVCGLMNAQVDYVFQRSNESSNLQKEVAIQKAETAFIVSSLGALVQSMLVIDCEIQCATSVGLGAASLAAGISAAGSQFAGDKSIAKAEADLRNFDANTVRAAANFQCQASPLPNGTMSNGGILQVESNARIASMLNDTLEVRLEALRIDYSARVAASEVGRLLSQAQRLQAQQEEAEQLALDVQQAQNDPNVRIYQNDSVLNADVSFKDALAVTYRLTRIYEYYTSQTYAKKEQLFLIRMITAGQYNLENYLLELENAFQSFEENFGNPDLRVLALSLRDDILQIPLLKPTGQPYSEDERIKLMQAKLKDVRFLDSRGYLTIPFSTDIKSVSPVTRNHKVRHVEIDLQGNRMGDSIGRVYLRMSGTGVVRNVADDIDYYVFPERLAVVNASFLGGKVYDPEIYRNFRFRDRPLVNTLWELVFNQRDELVNKDIDLGSLADMRVLIYYSDFTSL